MHIPTRMLEVKESTIPGSGKGLFTKTDIAKDSLIIEYKGRITTWEDVKHDAGNAYLYYMSSRHVIDARPYASAKARYANDARGISKIRGLNNNSVYARLGEKVYIKAVKNIPAGSEILVSYGKEYWDTHRENERLEKQQQRKKKS